MPKPSAERVAVGLVESTAGRLIVRDTPQTPWRVHQPGTNVFTQDLLLALPGFRPRLRIGEAVQLTLLGAFPQASDVPVLESAVVLNQPAGTDVDLTLDRGRILLDHHKTKGSTVVRVHFVDQHWDIVLEDSRAKVALELVSRWPAGVPFQKTARPGHQPSTNVYLLLLNGSARLANNGDQRALRGQVVYQWSSGQGAFGPIPLKKVPGWARLEDNLTPRERVFDLTAAGLRGYLGSDDASQLGSVHKALRAPFKGEAVEARALAVFYAGATDDVPMLLSALGDATHPHDREAAVGALRHWIGRGPGQDQKLFDQLVKVNYPAGQAEIILQLLHTFSAQDLLRPETFETLIDYLNHDKIAIRELALWHLTRLVPQGRDIHFDAGASADQRTQALAAWRRLIPAGKLPPTPRP